MKWLKIVLDFYINASIHVALAVCSLMRITAFYIEFTYNGSLSCFMFYATITGYNFVKYAGVAKLYHLKLTTSLKLIQLFSLGCFLLMCYYATQIQMSTLLMFVPLGVLTLLYAVPFLSGFQKNLRSVSFIKIIVVALIWSIATVLIPLLDVGVKINANVLLLVLQRFLLVFVLILPFDIRDVKQDAASLQTIPKKIGVKNTKKLGVLFLLLSLMLEYVIGFTFLKVFFIVVVLILILLWNASEKQQKYYSSFWVEALPILWMFLLFLL
ncbi:MAG: hypothetical protein ACPGU6_02520 [Tenacibaculum sp.]